MNVCPRTCHWWDTNHTTRCVRPEGHTGLHRDGVRWFTRDGIQMPQGDTGMPRPEVKA